MPLRNSAKGHNRDGDIFHFHPITPMTSVADTDYMLTVFKEWLKEARTLKTSELWEIAKSKLIGHFNYYGVTDNSHGISRYCHEVKKLLFKWLNRRGKRNCITWDKFNEMLERLTK